MVIFGGATGGSDRIAEPTWALSLMPPLRWAPYPAVVEVAPAELALPQVTLGDTVSVPFVLGNGGMDPLQVSAFRLPASLPGAGLTIGTPLDLGWSQSVPATLTLAAAAAGTVQDSLVVVSNDPASPRRVVAVRATVLGLDFAVRVLDEPAEVPLGASFVVVVTPAPGVRVERGVLYYRVAGAAAFDSVTLTPLATDFIAAVPAGAVTERGVEYFVRVGNSGYLSLRPAGAPEAVYTQPVARPAAITALPRPTSGSEFLEGRDIEVEVVLPEGAIFQSGALHYREGGSAVERTPRWRPERSAARPPPSRGRRSGRAVWSTGWT
jgi:hypothetical protein